MTRTLSRSTVTTRDPVTTTRGATAAVAAGRPARTTLPAQREAARAAGSAGAVGRRTAREPEPLTVAPPEPVPVPRAAFVLLVLAVVVAGVVGILLLNTRVNENAFILHDLRQEQVLLDRQQQELEQRLARYESPAHLAEAARRLGLVPAEEVGYLRMSDDRAVVDLVSTTLPEG